MHINRIGVIPKSCMGKWRLITDQQYLLGYSVNDASDPASCSLVYTMMKKVAQQTMCLGRGALMAKVDIESAYCLITVQRLRSSN